MLYYLLTQISFRD